MEEQRNKEISLTFHIMLLILEENQWPNCFVVMELWLLATWKKNYKLWELWQGGQKHQPYPYQCSVQTEGSIAWICKSNTLEFNQYGKSNFPLHFWSLWMAHLSVQMWMFCVWFAAFNLCSAKMGIYFQEFSWKWGDLNKSDRCCQWTLEIFHIKSSRITNQLFARLIKGMTALNNHCQLMSLLWRKTWAIGLVIVW